MSNSKLRVGGDPAALAPAGLGLALLVAMVEIRMDDPWSKGVLLLVAAAGAVALLMLGLEVARVDQSNRAAVTVLLVSGLVLAAVTIGRLGDVLAGDDFTEGGGTLTWMLALFAGLAVFCGKRAGSAACLLIAALAGVGLLLEFVNWVFDTDDVDTFRVLLAVAFAGLFAAGMAIQGRDGTILVGAAGVTALAGTYTTGLLFFGAASLGWGWELVMLAQGVALAAYAATRLEPGPAYLGFFVLAAFVIVAAIGGESSTGFIGPDDAEPEPSASLVGWPLALAIGTAAAAVWGLRGSRR